MSFFNKISNLNNTKKDLFCLSILVLIAVILRPLPSLGVMGRDETSYAFLAKHFLNGTFLDDYIFVAFHPFYSFLVAIFSLICMDIELSGRVLSYLFSIILIFPTFYIGKILFSNLAGFFAGFMTASFPLLIKWSIIVQPQTEYSFMLLMSMLFMVLLLKKEKKIFAFLSSLFLCLAYLSRAEGFGIFLGNLLLLTIFFLKEQKERKKSLLKGIFIFCLTFLVIASPYIYALKLKTGDIKFTNKLYAQIRQAVIVTYGLDYEKMNFGGLDIPKKDILLLAIYAYPEKLLEGLKNLPNYFGITPIFFSLLPLIIKFFRKTKISSYIYFVPYLYVIFILPFFFVAENYFIPYAPLVFILAGYGIHILVKNLEFLKEKKILYLSFILFLISFENVFYNKLKIYISKPVQKQDLQSIIYTSYRDFGKDISKSIETDAKIMSRFNIVSWYAKGEYVSFPDVSWEEFIKSVKDLKVDYIVIGPVELNARTDIAVNLLNYAIKMEGFSIEKKVVYNNYLEFYLIRVNK